MKKKLDCLKLVNFIEKSKDFQLRILSCRKILIAYSGGQDSTALLTVFYILSKKFSFNIGVVYCNHRWTNSNSGPIAAFEFVSHLSLPFYFVDAQKAIQPEEVARLWRYSSFKNIYLAYGYDLILTGHTLSDCAETVILNLCRGSGLRGVCSLKKFQDFKYQHFNTHKFRYIDFTFESKLTVCKNFDFKFKALKQSDKLSFGQLLFNYYEKSKDLENNSIQTSTISRVTYFDPLVYELGRKYLSPKKTVFPTYFLCKVFKLNKFHIPMLVLIYDLKKGIHQTELVDWIYQGIQNQQNSNKKAFSRLVKRKQLENCQSSYYYLAKLTNFKSKSNFVFDSFQNSFSALFPFLSVGNQNSILQRDKLSFVCITNFYIYRPLISIKRETISIFVSQLDLSIIYDQSNNDLNITRNFIRHIILPLLKKINPQVEQNLYKFSQIANYYLTYSGDIVISAINFEIFKA